MKIWKRKIEKYIRGLNLSFMVKDRIELRLTVDTLVDILKGEKLYTEVGKQKIYISMSEYEDILRDKKLARKYLKLLDKILLLNNYE